MERIEIEKITKSGTVKKYNTLSRRKLQKSIMKYGQIYPILVDEDNVIIKGNTVYDCLVAQNQPWVFIHRIDNVENKELLNIELSKLQAPVDFKYFLSILPNINLKTTLIPVAYEKLFAMKELLHFDWSKYKYKTKDIGKFF